MKVRGFRVRCGAPRVVAPEGSPVGRQAPKPTRRALAVAPARKSREAARLRRTKHDEVIEQAREADAAVWAFVTEIRIGADAMEVLCDEIYRLEIEAARTERENARVYALYRHAVEAVQKLQAQIRERNTRLHPPANSTDVKREELRLVLERSSSLWASVPSTLRKRRREPGAATHARQAQALLQEHST